MSDTIFRVHPFINIARVGNSEDYYIAPETAAGHQDPTTKVYGGLPIVKDTEDTLISEADLRDAEGNLVRQAARFRIYAFDGNYGTYPTTSKATEVKIGDTITHNSETKTITDIIWCVHLANKKANNYQITGNTDVLPNWGAENEDTELGIINYENGKLPPLRNDVPEFGSDISSEERRTKLVIDAGPRALSVSDTSTVVSFDSSTTPSYVDGKEITPLTNYPVSFPYQHFSMLYDPQGTINTLGEMRIEENTGRLIVTGGYGRAERIPGGDPSTLPPDGKLDAIDNDFWFDDTSDGPVTATIVLDDGSTIDAVHSWFIATDPGFAPQVRNIVSSWDDMFDTWVKDFGLIPDLYSNGKFLDSFEPDFMSELQPIFHGAFLQQWSTALPDQAIGGHGRMANITPSTTPTSAINDLDQLIRAPSDVDNDGLVPMNYEGKQNNTDQTRLMPLALGDAMKSFLTLTPTQYFFVQQWHAGKSSDTPSPIGLPDLLDRAVLENCLGGRYSPGIDITFIVRDPNLYDADHWMQETGPFRFNMAPLPYAEATSSKPFLQAGYIPLRQAAVEPGDICKFMSLPWHTDYNSCSIHLPDPNPVLGMAGGNRGPVIEANTLYWSWPSQRPVQIYPKEFCLFDPQKKVWNVGGQLFSLRGEGTLTPNPATAGAFQNYYDFINQWHEVGFVIQGTQVPDTQNGGTYGDSIFIEVQSQFDNKSDPVQPWPSGFSPIPTGGS